MKKLSELNGVLFLSKTSQKSIRGGNSARTCDCIGWPQGTSCYGGSNCDSPGMCVSTGGGYCALF